MLLIFYDFVVGTLIILGGFISYFQYRRLEKLIEKDSLALELDKIKPTTNKKKYEKAYQILKNHNLPINTESGREAEWLAGWVSIFHLKNARQSLSHFEKVFKSSKDENVKAKAAFWLSRAYYNLMIKLKKKIGLKSLQKINFLIMGRMLQ